MINVHGDAQVLWHDVDIRIGEGSSMGNSGSKSVYVSLPSRHFEVGNTTLFGYVDQGIIVSGEWRRPNVIAGVTPMVQFELAHEVPRICIEAGVGVNIGAPHEMDGRQLGGNFLFSPTVSAGIEVPWMNSFLGVFYLLKHFSNAGLFEDNQGINFHYIVFSMRFKEY